MFTYFFSNNALFGTEYTKRLRTLNLTFAFTPLKLHLCLNKRLCRQIFGASSYANQFRARVRATSSNRVHVRPACPLVLHFASWCRNWRSLPTAAVHRFVRGCVLPVVVAAASTAAAAGGVVCSFVLFDQRIIVGVGHFQSTEGFSW